MLISGLYKNIEFTSNHQKVKLYNYLHSPNNYHGAPRYVEDFYCNECKVNSIFELNSINHITNYDRISVTEVKDTQNQNNCIYSQSLLSWEIVCQRNTNHIIDIQTSVNENYIIKVGQSPSYADIATPQHQKYKKILDNDFVALNKAMGLYAHGIGAGSFVYLRRIFEHLIEEVHIQEKKKSDWDEEKYLQSRMGEKIGMLKENLPSTLVENKSIYSILSKGIHELEEDECRDLFPLVLTAIELILDEKLAFKNKTLKEKQLKKDLDKIKSELR